MQGGWAAAGSQQKIQSKPATKPVSATDVGKPTFQSNERVRQLHILFSRDYFQTDLFVHNFDTAGQIGNLVVKKFSSV